MRGQYTDLVCMFFRADRRVFSTIAVDRHPRVGVRRRLGEHSPIESTPFLVSTILDKPGTAPTDESK